MKAANLDDEVLGLCAVFARFLARAEFQALAEVGDIDGLTSLYNRTFSDAFGGRPGEALIAFFEDHNLRDCAIFLRLLTPLREKAVRRASIAYVGALAELAWQPLALPPAKGS